MSDTTESEPLLAIDEIQGNVIPGFNKPFLQLIGAQITDSGLARSWLGQLTDRITTAAEVLQFNASRRELRTHGFESAKSFKLSTSWLNVALSAEGLRALDRHDVDQFEDASFRSGLWQQSGILGDPNDTTEFEGAPKNWRVGGSQATDIHVLFIVAGDDAVQVESAASDLWREMKTAGSGLTPFYRETGADLPAPLTGHEHFGFKDSVSQPGIRGRISIAPNSFFTPRYIDPSDPSAALFARPGQPLIWPGQFLFGYPMQDALFPLEPGRDKTATPEWTTNGSFLVFRRLRQDVPRFREFMATTAAELAKQPGFSQMSPEKLAALLVGRWPSGFPVMRAPNADSPAQADDIFLNNNFTFDAATPAIELKPGVRSACDVVPGHTEDREGFVCPKAAHIRKVNSRDVSTEQGNNTDIHTRRFLRRGIPFGLPLPEGIDADADGLKGNRGLLFMCYQTSIVDQFEFISRTWMNQLDKPEPNNAGHDMIVGQNPSDPLRKRRCTLLRKADGQTFSATIEALQEWVIPTGGGYFFSPSISALRDVLSR